MMNDEQLYNITIKMNEISGIYLSALNEMSGIYLSALNEMSGRCIVP